MQRAWVTNPGPSTYPRLVGFEPTPLSVVDGMLYPIELQPQVEKPRDYYLWIKLRKLNLLITVKDYFCSSANFSCAALSL